MKRLLIPITTFVAFSSFGAKLISKQEYVDKWSPVAVQEMHLYGIPASITLAQGILESANGNSDLATKGNNHFGIKCHGWDGKKMYKDDDAKDECFRVYGNAEESFRDHSEFLKTYSRYAFLFEYAQDDYKSWAKGLKKAGYATNPKYPDMLIGIIEDLELYEFDLGDTPESYIPELIVSTSAANSNEHVVKTSKNGVQYIVAKNGDTFFNISKKYGITLGQLYRYNDFDKHKDYLLEGDIVYIKHKKHRNLFKKEVAVLDKAMTVNEIAQSYAISAKTIKRLNQITNDSKVLAVGEKVTLR